MTTFFIAISFLIHALSLFALIILFQRQNKVSEAERNAKQTAKEMEEMMTAFLIEIKEENEQLITQLAKNTPIEKIKKQEPASEKKPLPSFIPRQAAAKAYTGARTVRTKAQAQEEVPQTQKIAEMKMEGMTEEEIAKKLRIGVTEVQLALKFNKKE
ncbi:DUF6115 domain-containing protein [Domibacillus robiginosus]|uniref:DUF6115 domain-containing protein n=1 Tax=Domibacillus robiginosus TaxID=1071054 RepID=UPI00067E007C|nr:hypothetical protein [Domibacillus robiginosus]